MHFLARVRRVLRYLVTFVPVILRSARYLPNKPVDYSDALAPHFQRRPDRPVLIGESSRMTWGELDAQANRVAHWATAQGLSRGDVVALLMENRPEYIAVWLGLSRIGVVSALLNTNLTGDRLAHCIREAGTAHCIVGSELAAGLASALPSLESPLVQWIADREGETDSAAREALPEARSFDEAVSSQPPEAPSESVREARRGSDGLFLIYTSGTTGLPKAARLSHSKAIVMGVAAASVQRLTPADRVYDCLPLYHSAGGVMAVGGALVSGAGLVIARKFSAKRFWSDCVQHDVTSFQYIGELCRYLLNSPEHPDERRHRVRVALGNGLRPEVWRPFQERFGVGRIAEFYGATEGNAALVNHDGTVGAVGYLPSFMRKLQGVRIVRFDVDREEVVRSPDGLCVPCGSDEPGELLIKINETQRFEGYTNEEATRKKVLSDAFEAGDAYFRTGDLLRMDARGYFYFVDRIGDTFRWKGENVSTNEVAEVISVVAGVEEANVYGVEVAGADGRAGMAALVTTEDFDLDAFGRKIEQELAAYARPLFVRLLPQMEITGTFKHRKVDLVKEGFDPKVLGDPLYYRDPEKGGYVPLDPSAFERIEQGEIRV